MRFREVRVFGGDDDRLVPERLLLGMGAQPNRHGVCLTDVTTGIADGVFVFAKQEVHPGAF
ncbi:hypothetical protein D3C73_1504290 [compost metagenome]